MGNPLTPEDVRARRMAELAELGIDLSDRPVAEEVLDDANDPTGNRRHWARVHAEEAAKAAERRAEEERLEASGYAGWRRLDWSR